MPGFAPASPPNPERALLIAMAEALILTLNSAIGRVNYRAIPESRNALQKALDDYRRETE